MEKIRFKTFNKFDRLAINDNHQNLICNQFAMSQILKTHRDAIDEIDRSIAELLGKRFRIAEQVAEIKRQNNIPVRIEKRINEVLENATKNEHDFNLPPKLGYFLWREIIEATCYHEENLIEKHNL